MTTITTMHPPLIPFNPLIALLYFIFSTNPTTDNPTLSNESKLPPTTTTPGGRPIPSGCVREPHDVPIDLEIIKD